MSSPEQSLSMQPPPSPSIPIDPALALYPPYYTNYSQPPQHLPPHLSLPSNYSSPSSQGSDTIGTPPTEHMFPTSSNANGKRPAPSGNDSRKKARKDDDSDVRSPTAEKEEKAKPTRGSRACTVCRRLKMKCVGAEQGPPCKRCQAGNHECIFEESNRGKRSSKKHELLTRSIRKMERTLDTVLKSIGNPSIASGMLSRSPSPSPATATTQALIAASPSSHSPGSYHRQTPGSPKLHSLPDNALNPLGLLAEGHGMLARGAEANGTPVLGVASDNYFKPGPMTILPLRRLYIERQVQPEMLSFVSTNEVVKLFKMFMHSNLLDKNFHTPSLVCSRSPFLLTTICAISSKFYTEKPDLHPRLNELAKKLAFSVPARGYKSLEIVQAYLLLTLWGCGAVERFEQDKTWLLLGMAIRMATDLNLHRKTTVSAQDGQDARAREIEVHNRERTWIFCFCLDRSFSAQMGKPYSIKEDFIIRNVDKWCSLPCAAPSDAALAAYAELQAILSRSLDFLYSNTESGNGLHTTLDYLLIIRTFEDQIFTFRRKWIASSETTNDKVSIEHEYKARISEFYFNYTLLVLNSFGLQNAIESAPLNVGHFFARVHTSAINCATIVRDHLGPNGFMKYSPDSHSVQTSYAVLSLLKLVRPEFSAYLEDEQKTLTLCHDVADVLEKVSVSPHHTTALYGGFLKALITAKMEASWRRWVLPMDISTFPPTMAPNPSEEDIHNANGMTMDSILSSNFWDSVLVPGFNRMDGLSGGFVFGANGSGLITPRIGLSPYHSGANTPLMNGHGDLTQMSINAAFDQQSDGITVKLDS
ncbi:fungal-specific transcription factor domain-containing protein [Desarmillaria tabescens]|uniref:Fungal-specific transcription factor domain-containing protein n=1 Tax=Armillaria tabescens TaxID=1929756 RepID=A0AA39T4C3_ARMTA|nr:fungal-specific transcription factor domain-containing protein [Desarmillaria tabescens]KAK0463601.1 fungal-specific transcription factor domain-containing protein [Desarmillaria tabescens]